MEMDEQTLPYHLREGPEAVQLARRRQLGLSAEDVEISDASAQPGPEGLLADTTPSSRKISQSPSARRVRPALDVTDGRAMQAPSSRRRTADSRSVGRTEPGLSRQRARGVANPLPAAFPPPPRGNFDIGDGDEASSTSSSRTSPEIDGASVSSAALDVANELELSVPSHQEHLTADGQRYTTYEVLVRMGGRQWSVRKRYSQFDQFRMSLRRQHKEVGSFRFPNKSKFNTFSEHTKERRRTGFDEFLRLVANLHPRPEEVDVFLAMDEHGAGVRGRSGNRPLAWTSTKAPPLTASTDPALGRAWSASGRVDGGRQFTTGSGVVRISKGGTAHRIPRFPPLADQGRSEKAAEAAAAVAAAAATTSSRSGLSGAVRQTDLLLRRLLGPDLLSMLCVVAVSAVSVVAVWKVGGRPGLFTLVMAVVVGLFIQNTHDRGQNILKLGLELVGINPDSAQPRSPGRHRTASYASNRSDRAPAELASASLGRQTRTVREARR
ncbi:unnamed protein product [Scytosiphon promiscuus]